MLVILLVALVVLGPTKLPTAIRQVGRVVGELRRIGAGFQQELREATEPLRETQATLKAADKELREATKPLKETAGTIKGAGARKTVAPPPKAAHKPATDPFAAAVASSAAAPDIPSAEPAVGEPAVGEPAVGEPAAGEPAGSTDATGEVPTAESVFEPDADADASGASDATDGAAEHGSSAGGGA